MRNIVPLRIKNMEKKICVISGASGGIGSSITAKFLKEDYDVVMVDVSMEKIRETIEREGFDEKRVLPCVIDISDEKSVKEGIERIVAAYGHIDALINAAGICGEYSQTIEYSFENFQKVYSVNVFGTFLMMKNVLAHMVERNKGAIVNFGSVSGMRGYSFEIGYGSSKWAIIGMSETVANEYGSDGIRCNSVSPGWVSTCMMEKTLENYRKLGIEDPGSWISYGSIGRAAKPHEIADAVYYLCSEQASYINGANIVVDGGMIIK